MKIYLTFLAVIFSTIIIAQESSKENKKLVIPDFILEEFLNLEFNTFNYEGEPGIRHYGIDDNILFGAFGADGEGAIGNENNFNKDELLYISLIAIKGLKENNDKLNQTVLELENEIIHLRDNIEVREDPSKEIDFLRNKVEELSNQPEAIENNEKLNQIVLELENEVMRLRDNVEDREDPTKEIDFLRIKVEELSNKLETFENN